MSTRPLLSPGSDPTRGNISPLRSYRLVWACLPVMLIMSGVVLFLFGLACWTAVIIVLLLACPASIAVAIYMGFSRRNDAASFLRAHPGSLDS
jgi:cytochrome c oxidase subunit IV